MLDRTLKLLFFLFSILFIIYLVLPEPVMPAHLPNSVQSTLSGDLETPTRVAYFTDMTRAEVMEYYKGQFSKSSGGVELPTLNLNYPPEEALILVRDQTYSTFLEELAHPFRESLFINGFEPKLDRDSPLIVDGKNWRQKVTIRYNQSEVLPRVLIAITTLMLLYIVVFEVRHFVVTLIKK